MKEILIDPMFPPQKCTSDYISDALVSPRSENGFVPIDADIVHV